MEEVYLQIQDNITALQEVLAAEGEKIVQYMVAVVQELLCKEMQEELL